MPGMIERVLLVAWKGSTARSWVDVLQSGGYTVVLEDTTGERAWRTAKERGIDCVIIDGEKKPTYGRQTGNALRDTAKTRNIPIIWTNLVVEDVAGVQFDVKPDVLLSAPTDATSALLALQALTAELATALASAAPLKSASATPARKRAPKRPAQREKQKRAAGAPVPKKKPASGKRPAAKKAPVRRPAKKTARRPARAAKRAQKKK